MTDASLKAIFTEEAASLLGQLSAGALELEGGATGSGTIDQLFRAAHTLKGSAAMVGLHEVSTVTHALEDLLQQLRSGRLNLTPAVADVILETVGALCGAIPRLLEGEPMETVGPGLVTRLAQIAGREPPHPLPEDVRAPAAAGELESATRAEPGADTPTASSPADAGRVTILVVEDALTVRERQRSILERAGYTVVTAADGRLGLSVLATLRPDLVLTDIEMPDLDGFGLIEAIRAQPRLASVPVIIVSSRDDPEHRARGLQAGADDYLVKQAFDEATLLAAVSRMLGSSRTTPPPG
jgi:CheY-like chemotaxis protein/HPt (histidine-containing phosphotransfer) domain-containing protein